MQPFVTIIMPIRNESEYIIKSLGAVLKQDYPSVLIEILVVDGMSVDDTRKIVNRLKIKHSNIQLLDNPYKIVPTGLNLALKQAKGDIIIRVDGHCVIPKHYVKSCIHLFDHLDTDCVGGSIQTIGETFIARCIAVAQSSLFGVGSVAFRTRPTKGQYVDTLAFGAYQREVFDLVGLFDEELVRNQDDEFNFRLIQSGGKIWLDSSIQSVYYSRASFYKLWRQYFQYGFYKVRVIQKRGAVPSWRHLVPAGFAVGLILSIFLALITKQPLWLLAVASPYAVANFCAALLSARKNWKTLPFLPLAFLSLHLSYGLGFISGLWHWRKYFFHGNTR